MRKWTLAIALLASVGCLERRETIQVRDDGSVRLEVRIEGDRPDLNDGDALPTAQTGWTVTESAAVDEKGNEKVTRIATRELAVGAPFPSSHAADRHEEAGAALLFPTEVVTDPREDGTYYHFRRTYVRRAWWTLEFLRQELFETDDLKAILAKDPHTLTADERARLVSTFQEYGARELGVMMQEAERRMPAPLPQLAFLKGRAAGQAVMRDQALAERVIGSLTGGQKVDLAPLVEEVRQRSWAAMEAALREAGATADRIDGLRVQWEKVRAAWEITSDLSDESWVVTVELPGRIVGHNSDLAVDPARPAGTVEWRFPGKALFDRDQILRATSFVPGRGSGGKR